MQTIVVASRKGGSAKSTITRHLAVEIERTAGKVAMLDADPMRGLSGWWHARAADTPLLIDLSRPASSAL